MRITCDAVGEDVLSNMDVHGRKRVVHDVQVSISIRSARHADALLLAAAQVDALLADLCLVPCRQNLQAECTSSAPECSFPC